jgi:hypothetical protein
MKKLACLIVFLLLMTLTAMAALASPIMPTIEKYAFYVTGNSFGGGDIDGYEIGKLHGLGMGAVIPINKVLSAGIRFGSDNYDDHNFALQASLFPKEDGYLYRLDFNRFGSDGSITHLGVYRDFPDDMSISLCGGGGLAFVSFSDAEKSTYISMFVELQARVSFSEGFFGYTGIAYDYHLGATTIEAGLGMNI